MSAVDKLAALKALKEVVDAGGFSSAARRLGVATSSVTRLVDALESSLGQTLLTRTTRNILLTEAGRAYMDQITRILADLAQADQSILDSGTQPAGTLRVSVAATYSRLRLAPVFAAFLQAHPGVVLDIDDSDRYLDLATAQIDVAIRIGTVDRDKGLVVRKLAESPRFIVASPAYLDAHGAPPHFSSLSEHNCLRFAYGLGSRLTPQKWTFSQQDTQASVEVSGTLVVNDLDMLLQAALTDRGIALLPQWLVQPELREGRLTRLFADFQVCPPVGNAVIYAAYLPNRRYSSKVRAFLRFIEAHVEGHPEHYPQ